MPTKRRNTLDDVDLKPLEVYTLFDSVLPTDTGIYAIVNKLDKRFYLGSARAARPSPSQKGFRSRFGHNNGHREQLINNRHHCRFLQRAYNAVLTEGLNPNDVFEIWIIEHVPSYHCLDIEDEYLKYYRPTYNGVLTARGVADGEYTPSVETRKKWSIAATGRSHSPETCAKISAFHKDKKKTPEHVENLSLAKSDDYIGIAPWGEIFYFKGAKNFALANNLIKACILKCSRGVQKDHKDWLFFRQDDNSVTTEYLEMLSNKQKLTYRQYVAVSPTGEIFRFCNSSDFAHSQGLRTERVNECADRRRLTHKNWHIYYYDDPEITEEYISQLSSEKKHLSSYSSKYVGLSPHGEIIYFDNEYTFAREHNLKQSGITRCLSGKADHHKTWKFYYSHDPRLTESFLKQVSEEQRNAKLYEYVGISPEGEVFYFDNAAEFCREHDLLTTCISKCALGQSETHRDWRFYFKRGMTPDLLDEIVRVQKTPIYEAISPTGEVFPFKSIHQFVKGKPFSRNGISQCVNGRVKTHRGWVFRFYTESQVA